MIFRKSNIWLFYGVQSILCLVVQGCHVHTGLNEDTNNQAGVVQGEAESALEVRLEQLPPKSRTLILNRLAETHSLFRLRDEDEAPQAEPQQIFIVNVTEMLRLEGRADTKTVAILKEVAIQLAKIGELDRFTSESKQTRDKQFGWEGIWATPAWDAAAGSSMQAFDVATCLFQISDRLLPLSKRS